MPPLFNVGPFTFSTDSTMASATQRPSASPYAITITLTSNICHDRRVITLQPGQGVKIGRASKSEIKNLQPADDNALFDCPVVSRQHAELRVSSWQPRSEQVTITDLTSLHGTTVNGRRLDAQRDFTLKTGDVIKLGERVTRGDDTHDGLSLTYRRLDETNQYREPSPPAPSYQVPSEPEASDYESDLESIRSISRHESSAHTTPENIKMKLGSQDQPIFIGDSVPAPVIDLAGDEQKKFSNIMPPAQLRVVPDTYDEEIESLVAEEDDVDDGAYIASDNESLNEGSVSASDDGIDESAVFDDDVVGNEDDQDLFREDISVEVDRFSDDEASVVNDAQANGFNAPPSDLLTSIKEKIAELRPSEHFHITNDQAQPTANSFTEPKPRYDPVRNSQPPADDEAISSGAAPTFKPNRSYTSRWDMRPPQAPAFQYGGYSKPEPVPSMFDNYFNPQPYVPFEPIQPTNPWLTAPQQPLPPLPHPYAPEATPAQPPISPVSHDASITATTSKIAIGSIIDKDGLNQDGAGVIEPQQAPSPVGNKRKACEMEADVEMPEASAASENQQITHVAAAASPRSKRRRTRRHGTMQQLTCSLAKYTGAAAVGAAATVAFLSSPAAQWIIDYLG